MPHFFVPPGNVQGSRFHLDPAESRHLAVILRRKPGDEVSLFDGADRSFRAVLETVTPERVAGTILAEAPRRGLLPYRLRLFQGLPKGEKMEWILEKMTELGAAEIVPVVTERSVARVPADRLGKRLERWRRIVLAAAKQCGRPDLPQVREPLSFPAALALCGPSDATLLPWEGECERSLKDVVRGRGGEGVINLFIGPEGGFSPAEVEAARARGAVPVSLGPLILRTETAGLMAASAVLYEFGVLK